MAKRDAGRRRIWLAAATVIAAAAFVGAAALPDPAAVPANCSSFQDPPVPAAPAASGPTLALALQSDGSIDGVVAGGERLGSVGPPGGFSVRVVGGTRNLLANPGFEDDGSVPSGWAIESPANGAGEKAAPAPQLDPAEAHSGERSIRIESGARATSRSFVQELTVQPGTDYVLSVWTKGRDVQPTIPAAVREPTDPHSPVRVEVVQPGAPAAAGVRTAYGYTDTSGWSRQFVGFRTGPEVRRVRIAGGLHDGSGTAWFDDLSVSKLFRGGWTPVRGGTTSPASSDDSSELRGAAGGGDLELRARLASGGSVIRVDGAIESSARGDRAVQVRFAIPVDATGWRWGDYARSERVIAPGRSYAYLTTSSQQQTSRYPFGEVSGPRVGLAMGIPLSQPRIFRVQYRPDSGLSIEFDLGLSPSATGLGPSASFSFVAFAFDPAWGFRAATEAYHDVFPEAFAVRVPPACQGAWFVAPPVYGLLPDDFGLGLDMVALGKAPSQRFGTWGMAYLRWDNAAGIAASAYNHHWAFYQPQDRADPTPSAAAAEASLRALARSDPAGEEAARLRDEARAALASASRDVNGRAYVEWYRTYLAWYQNLEPLTGADWTTTVREQQMDRALRMARTAGGDLAGIHLDSTSGMRRWGAADDYDRDHWAAATLPLTFSYDSGLVTLRGIFPMYGDIVRTADFVHARGMLLSANFNGDEVRALSFVGADRIDYFGLEQGLEDRATPEMSVDRFAMLKRSMASQRPVSTLDQRVGQGRLGPGEAERRLQLNLFYGIFMGAWDGAGEADGRAGAATWTATPYRTVWARYAPRFDELARAGWEPVTLARSSDPSVWIERFGSPSDGAVFLTLRNETGQDRDATITLDLSTNGLTAPGGPDVLEELTGTRLPVTTSTDGRSATFRVSVPADATRLVRLEPGPPA